MKRRTFLSTILGVVALIPKSKNKTESSQEPSICLNKGYVDLYRYDDASEGMVFMTNKDGNLEWVHFRDTQKMIDQGHS